MDGAILTGETMGKMTMANYGDLVEYDLTESHGGKIERAYVLGEMEYSKDGSHLLLGNPGQTGMPIHSSHCNVISMGHGDICEPLRRAYLERFPGSLKLREVIALVQIWNDPLALAGGQISKTLVNGHENADLIIAAVEAAGFAIVSKTLVQAALNEATASDNWHKYGEGYNGLRLFLEKMIAASSLPPPNGRDIHPVKLDSTVPVIGTDPVLKTK